MNITVILPAAGLGSRFAVGEGSEVRASSSKIAFELAHKPAFVHAIELFNGRAEVGQILLAVHPRQLDDFAFRWAEKLSFLGVTLIAGGEADRWETVKLALDQVADDATHIAVHDAARPCASHAMIERVFAAAEQLDAVVPGLPMADTVKRVGEIATHTSIADPLEGVFDSETSPITNALPITQTVDRQGLYRVQTPQVFERTLLTQAYAQLNADNAEGITDDASVVERAGKSVYIVEGDPLNLKLTHPADAELIEAVLKMREEKAAKNAAVKQLFGDDDDD